MAQYNTAKLKPHPEGCAVDKYGRLVFLGTIHAAKNNVLFWCTSLTIVEGWVVCGCYDVARYNPFITLDDDLEFTW